MSSHGQLSRFVLAPALFLCAYPMMSRATDCDMDGFYKRALSMALHGSNANAADKQIDPPTASGASAALVDSPQQTRLIAAALQQGLVNRNDTGAFTLSLAPFAWVNAAAAPGYTDTQSTYDRYNVARRLTGSLTLGGNGDPIDADGDGKPDDPADAKNLTDNFAIEMQYRFIGSRDRRDYAIPADLQGAAANFMAAMAHSKVRERFVDPVFDELNGKNLDDAACTALAKQVSLSPDFSAVLKADENLSTLIAQRENQIDTSWVWSIAATAVERKSYLGPDKYSIALRGLKGIEAQSYHKFNLELGRVNSLAPGQPNIDTAKLAYEYSRPVLTGIDLGGGQPTFSAALFAERYRNAPSPAPSSVATLGVKWVFPISKGISVPLSISWANHTALLSDKDEVFGHVGINLDLDQLSKL